MDRNIDNVRHKTEAGHGGVEEQSEETSFVSTVVLESWWDILWRHQHHQRHVEIVRERRESEGIIGVEDEKCWPPGEGKQITGEQTAVLLELPRVLVVGGLHVPLGAHQDAAHVVASVLRVWSAGKGAVSRDVEEESPVRRELLVSGCEEDHEVRQGRFV